VSAQEESAVCDSYLDRVTRQARVDLGRTVPDEPPREPAEIDADDERLIRAYRKWLEERACPVGRSWERERARLRELLGSLETQIDRKVENAKHAPTKLDRERAERRIAALESQAIQVREALGPGEGGAFTWDEAYETEASAAYCRMPVCGAQLRDAQESFDQSGYCRPCFAAWTGASNPPKGATP
jgi:hypothetical protein